MLNRESAVADPNRSTISPGLRAVNFSLAAMHILVNICQFFILPLYLLPKSMWWGLILVPFAALNNALWALIHECIHDLFASSERINLAVGRWLSIFFGSPFHVLRLTHLSHHKFNRSPLEKGTEIYDPEEVSRIKAGFRYFFYILCGLYLLEISSTLLFFLPPNVFSRLRQRVAERGNIQEKWLAGKLMNDQWVRETRMDGLAIVLIFALSAFCYGQNWKLLAGFLIVRALSISFLDNVYHYGTTLNITVSGHNLWLPRMFSSLFLNFNLHRVHHRNPGVPWAKLPELFAQQSERFDRNFFAAALRQLRGPVPVHELAGYPAEVEARKHKIRNLKTLTGPR